ncbi:serine kinase [Planktotalea sp.]|uniref:HPr kinase/phosphorylase n=1 Tax=Planktotalea sp. TaxID=2029877 RepID=UPI003298E0F3
MTSTAIKRIHATSVSWQGQAVLLLGPSGSGKSSVALKMLAFGCDLVADDQCDVRSVDGDLFVSCPTAIIGQIEARNFGILRSNSVEQARVVCAVDLAEMEEKRLPDERKMSICGTSLRLFHNCGIEGLPFALLQYLKGQAIN